MNIVVLISGNGSNLQAIIDEIQAGKLKAHIGAVISDQPDAHGLTRAKKSSIPTHIVERMNFKNRDDFDRALQSIIDDHQPKLIVLAGFMRVLGRDFVRHYEGRLINIHPSLLPKYPGLNTHQRVLDAHEKEHGVTIHYVTEDVDAGPIIAQASIPVRHNDTAKALEARIHKVEHRLYPEVLRRLTA